MTAGVYAIYIMPAVYIGESSNIEHRFAVHRDTWAWPNDARYRILYECVDAHRRKELERLEHEEHSQNGFLLLSAPGCGNTGLRQAHRARSSWDALTKAQRVERINKAWATRHGRTRKALGQLRRWQRQRKEMTP